MTIVDPSALPGLGWWGRTDLAGQTSGIANGIGLFDLLIDRSGNSRNLTAPATAAQRPRVWSPSYELNVNPAAVTQPSANQVLDAAAGSNASWKFLHSTNDSTTFWTGIPIGESGTGSVILGTMNGSASDVGAAIIYDPNSERIGYQNIVGSGSIVNVYSAARSVLRGRLACVVLWQSGGTWALYVNNVIVASGARVGMSSANPTYPMRMFNYAGSTSGYFIGETVEVGAYTARALSTTELTDLYGYMSERYYVPSLAADTAPTPAFERATGAKTVVFLGDSTTLCTTGCSVGYQGGVRRRVGDLFSLLPSASFFTITQAGPNPSPYAANDGQSGSTIRGNTPTPTNGHAINSSPPTSFQINNLFGAGKPYTGLWALVMNIGTNNYGAGDATMLANNNLFDVYQLGVDFHALEPQAIIVLWGLTLSTVSVTGNTTRLRYMHCYALAAVVRAWRALGIKVVYAPQWLGMGASDLADNLHSNDDGCMREGALIAKALLIAGGIDPNSELVMRLWQETGDYPVGSYTGFNGLSS